MAELAPKDVIFALRKPSVIFTEDFLNDVIKTKTDSRLNVESLLKQIQTINVVNRDPARFAHVDIGFVGPVIYPVLMSSPIYGKNEISKFIDVEFREF